MKYLKRNASSRISQLSLHIANNRRRSVAHNGDKQTSHSCTGVFAGANLIQAKLDPAALV